MIGQRATLIQSRDLIVCDHCEYVVQCDLSGSEDSTCPHHYKLYIKETEIMTIDIAPELKRFVKIKTEERDINILFNEEDFRIQEYLAS